MYTTNLMAIQDAGGKLIMMDGTIWLISPADIKITSTWEPPCSIQIQEGSSSMEYDYQIINLDTNVAAGAKKRR